ncbi:hypothetical protein OIDMADRAFT_58244 [Oidiodendron maius Zn]|uniref:Uncharacterized protein n=1 Tax=Oidiodendron maius (strain Zn) TaxID=913774 RepID=A0A0C3GZV7_OIDMZ|nr:hypothetical protein OIDMADRAFT_58244 [Oidiodendron maius Zn]
MEFDLHDSGLDTLRYPAICPNCGMLDCIDGPQTCSPFLVEPNNCSPANLPWTEQTFSLDAYQPICPNSSTSTPSLNIGHAPLTLERPTPAKPGKSAQGTNCSCLREILLVGEQLDRWTASKVGFNDLFMLSRRVTEAGEQYLRCRKCKEFLITTLCITSLRRTSAYYRELASQESFALDERTFRCRVGSFEADAELDEDTCKLVLCAEIERSSRSMIELEKLLGAEGKEARQIGHFTLHYYQDVIKIVKSSLQGTIDLLNIKDG